MGARPLRSSAAGAPLREHAVQLTGACDAHLLTDDRADRDFEGIPASGHTHPGARRDRRRERRIGGKACVDRRQVRVEVEHAADPFDGVVRSALPERDAKCVLPAIERDREHDDFLIPTHDPAIRRLVHLLHAVDRAACEEAERARPVERPADGDHSGRARRTQASVNACSSATCASSAAEVGARWLRSVQNSPIARSIVCRCSSSSSISARWRR